MQVNVDGQLQEAYQNEAAALPPSMLNMGWEYPAQLLQGADPVLTARHQPGREYTNEQPNNAVSTLAALECVHFPDLLANCTSHTIICCFGILWYCLAHSVSATRI